MKKLLVAVAILIGHQLYGASNTISVYPVNTLMLSNAIAGLGATATNTFEPKIIGTTTNDYWSGAKTWINYTNSTENHLNWWLTQSHLFNGNSNVFGSSLYFTNVGASGFLWIDTNGYVTTMASTNSAVTNADTLDGFHASYFMTNIVQTTNELDYYGGDLAFHNLTNAIHTAATNVYEPVFGKGNIVQGTNISLSGLLTNRLVGTGDVTISSYTIWTNIVSVPTVFPVTNHFHPGSDITNIATNALYAGTATNALSGWPTNWPWESITNKPTVYAPTNHYHPGSDITNIVTNATYASTATNALSGWPTNWPWSSITNPPTTDLITEGSTNLYYTTSRVLLATTNVYEPVITGTTTNDYWSGAKTWINFTNSVANYWNYRTTISNYWSAINTFAGGLNLGGNSITNLSLLAATNNVTVGGTNVSLEGHSHTSMITGTGTVNKLPIFTSATNLGNSLITYTSPAGHDTYTYAGDVFSFYDNGAYINLVNYGGVPAIDVQDQALYFSGASFNFITNMVYSPYIYWDRSEANFEVPLMVTEKVGIGTSTFPQDTKLRVVHTSSYGLGGRGIQVDNTYTGNYASTAIDSTARTSGSNPQDHIVGIQNGVILGGTDVVTNAYGIFNYLQLGSGGCGNAYNVYFPAITGTATLKYGIWQDGEDELNVFRGYAIVGGTSAGNRFSVIGSQNIGSLGYNVAAPSNGLLVEGAVLVGGTTLTPDYKLDVRGAPVFGTTRKIAGYPDFAGSGELAGGAMFGTLDTNSFYIAPSFNAGNSGYAVGMGYYNGSGWLSGLEVTNTSSGFSVLKLMKGGGNVTVGDDIIFYPGFGGSGDVPASAIIGSLGTNNMFILPSPDSGTSGKLAGIGYYTGASWRSAVEVANTTGYGTLELMKSGGTIHTPATTQLGGDNTLKNLTVTNESTLNGLTIIGDLTRIQDTFTGVPTGASGDGLEFYVDGSGNTYIQGYDRTASSYSPIKFYGSSYSFNEGDLAISGNTTINDLTRIQGAYTGVPTDAAGVGIELYNTLTQSYLQSYDRTGDALTKLTFNASTFQFNTYDGIAILTGGDLSVIPTNTYSLGTHSHAYVTGSGAVGTFPLWATSTTNLGNSILEQVTSTNLAVPAGARLGAGKDYTDPGASTSSYIDFYNPASGAFTISVGDGSYDFPFYLVQNGVTALSSSGGVLTLGSGSGFAYLTSGVLSTVNPTTLAGFGITNAYTKQELQTGGSSQVNWNNITSLPTTLSGFGITDAYTKTELSTSGSSSVHWDNITDVPASWITNIPPGTVDWNDITNKPSTFTPSAHYHPYSDVTNLTSWAGSTNINTLGTIMTGVWHGTPIEEDYIGTHSHSTNDVTDLPAQLQSRSPTNHTHTAYAPAIHGIQYHSDVLCSTINEGDILRNYGSLWTNVPMPTIPTTNGFLAGSGTANKLTMWTGTNTLGDSPVTINLSTNIQVSGGITATNLTLLSGGGFVAGTNVTLSGTLANRLAGSGDVTVSVTLPTTYGQMSLTKQTTNLLEQESADDFTEITLNATTTILRINGTTTNFTCGIKGITGGVDGRILHVINNVDDGTGMYSYSSLKVHINAPTATATNSIIKFPNDTDTPDEDVYYSGNNFYLIYDGDVQRWVIFGTPNN